MNSVHRIRGKETGFGALPYLPPFLVRPVGDGPRVPTSHPDDGQ